MKVTCDRPVPPPPPPATFTIELNEKEALILKTFLDEIPSGIDELYQLWLSLKKEFGLGDARSVGNRDFREGVINKIRTIVKRYEEEKGIYE